VWESMSQLVFFFASLFSEQKIWHRIK
jgi:hypothetical protein